MDFSGKVVLITGGSSGIGLELARQLVERGAFVFLAARRRDELERALETFRTGTGEVKVGLCCYDIRDPQQVNLLVQEVIREKGLPDILINAAGVAHPGYIQDLDLDIYEWMMQTNYFGMVYTVKALFPGMIQRGSGVIVNIASLASYIGVFGYSAYGASKFAVRGFTEALRMEAKPYGIQVSIVLPPDTDTPQLAYENQYKPKELKYLLPEMGVISAGQVAKAVIKGIERNRYEITADLGSRVILIAHRLGGPILFPVLDWLLKRAQARIRREREMQAASETRS